MVWATTDALENSHLIHDIWHQKTIYGSYIKFEKFYKTKAFLFFYFAFSFSSRTDTKILRHRLQISVLILSEFKCIN